MTLTSPAGARETRTDETGAFTLTRVAAGQYALDVRRLGYEQVRQTIEVRGDTTVLIDLTRVAALDTVRVRAANQGIYGVVGTASALRPLQASVQVVGASGTTVQTDSSGRFFVELKTPGVYLVRARSPGFAPQAMSVTLVKDTGVEVALLLDSATTGEGARYEMGWADFNERAHYRVPSRSSIVPGTDLAPNAAARLVDAVRMGKSFVKSGLRFSSNACVFVEGLPKPGLSINAFDPNEVLAVETYGPNLPRRPAPDGTGMLLKAWPRNAPCGDTGLPYSTPGDEVVYWVVVWLKH